jgi:hypothetical protein
MRAARVIEDGKHPVRELECLGRKTSMNMVVKNGMVEYYFSVNESGDWSRYLIPCYSTAPPLPPDRVIHSFDRSYDEIPYGWCKIDFMEYDHGWDLFILTHTKLDHQDIADLAVRGDTLGNARGRFSTHRFEGPPPEDIKFDPFEPRWHSDLTPKLMEMRKIVDGLHFPVDSSPTFLRVVQEQLMRPLGS